MSTLTSRRNFLLAAGAGVAGITGSVAYAFTGEPHHVAITPHEVPSPGLPADLDGLSILQISDVHLYHGIHVAAERTMALAAGVRPDITLFTGDMCEKQSQLGNLQTMLRACRGRLATYVIMGNWEYYAGVTAGRLSRVADAAGAELLYNHARIVRAGNASLGIIGLDDPKAGHADPDAALASFPSDLPTVWTFHAPGLADKLSRDRYPAPTFIASGHTHGGQIRLPPIPAITPPGSGRFVAGWYRDTFAPLYVSRGVGTTDIRARFLCPPEIPLFTLRRT